MIFVHETALEYGTKDHKKWKMRIELGRWFLKYIGPIREKNRTEAITEREMRRLVGNRLSVEQLEELTAYLNQVKDLEIRRDYFKKTELNKTFGGIAAALVSSVLDRYPVRTVVNIGAYYAFVDYVLATQYPALDFRAIEFVDSNFNNEFARSNLRFISGYAMDLISEEGFWADLVVFSATAAEIMGPELRKYLEILRGVSRYLVFSEPLYKMPDGSVIDPKCVSPVASLAAYAQPFYLPHRKGPVAHIHNYWELLQEFGYKVLHYRVYKPDFTDIRWIEVVATTE